MFSWPWGVAVDACNTDYVVDRGNRRIQRISADGVRQDEIEGLGLVNPIRLAVGTQGLIAVVDVGSNTVVVIASGIRQVVTDIDKPRSVAINANGKIYVGDGDGLIHVLVPDTNERSGYRNAGAGMTSFAGEIVDLVWDGTYGLLAIVADNDNGRRQRLWKIDPSGAPADTGSFITKTLDSKIPQCQWHRVLL